MKADKLRTFLVSALLAAALALGSVGSFATAFELLPEAPVRIALILAAVSLLGALLCPRRHGTLLLLCAGGLMLGYLWRTGDLPVYWPWLPGTAGMTAGPGNSFWILPTI